MRDTRGKFRARPSMATRNESRGPGPEFLVDGRQGSGCYDNRMDSPILLTSQRFTVGIAPKLGGALLWFGTTGATTTEFVRTTPVRALAEHDVRATAGYPLVPYSNRIGDGRF